MRRPLASLVLLGSFAQTLGCHAVRPASQDAELEVVEERRPDEDRVLVHVDVVDHVVVVELLSERVCVVGDRTVLVQREESGGGADTPTIVGAVVGVSGLVAVVGGLAAAGRQQSENQGCSNETLSKKRCDGDSTPRTVVDLGLVAMVVGGVISIIGANLDPPVPPTKRATVDTKWKVETLVCGRAPLVDVQVAVSPSAASLGPKKVFARARTDANGKARVALGAEAWWGAPLQVTIGLEGKSLVVLVDEKGRVPNAAE